MGEFTLVIAGAVEKEGLEEVPLQDAVAILRSLKEAGTPARQAVAQVALQYDIPRRQVYQMWLGLGT